MHENYGPVTLGPVPELAPARAEYTHGGASDAGLCARPPRRPPSPSARHQPSLRRLILMKELRDALSEFPPESRAFVESNMRDNPRSLRELQNQVDFARTTLALHQWSNLSPAEQNLTVRLALRGVHLVAGSTRPPSLPPYNGGKTTGVLRTSLGDAPIQSGRRGPGGEATPGSSGFDIVSRTHVEGHAAMIIRAMGVNEATLFINNPVVCSSCVSNLPRMLPAGVRLTVVTPVGSEVYVGQ